MTKGEGSEAVAGEGAEGVPSASHNEELERLLGEAKITEAELESLLGASNDEVSELRGKLATAMEPKKGQAPILFAFTVVVDRAIGRFWVPNIPKQAAMRVAMAKDFMRAATLVLETMK